MGKVTFASLEREGHATGTAQGGIGVVQDPEGGADELLVVVDGGTCDEAQRQVIHYHLDSALLKYPV